MSNDMSDLSFSFSSLEARTKFYEDYNIINIFVEDKNKEYEYEEIFKRMFDAKIFFGRVFSCGGKLKVIEKYREDVNKGCAEERIYIVDGDFDRYINPEEMIKASNFIYLKSYNIENYFIDAEVCYTFVKGLMKCCDEEVRKKFNFLSWKEKIVNQSTKLFLLYCYLIKNNYKEKTVDRNYGLFLDYNTGFERETSSYKEFEQQISLEFPDYRTGIEEIRKKYISENGENFFYFICGKFLIVSLSRYIRSVSNKKFREDDFRWELISHFDVSNLNYVKEIILIVINNTS